MRGFRLGNLEAIGPKGDTDAPSLLQMCDGDRSVDLTEIALSSPDDPHVTTTKTTTVLCKSSHENTTKHFSMRKIVQNQMLEINNAPQLLCETLNFGSGGGIRTPDLVINSHSLYH